MNSWAIHLGTFKLCIYKDILYNNNSVKKEAMDLKESRSVQGGFGGKKGNGQM